MSLGDYIAVVRRFLPLLALMSVVTLGVAIGVSSFMTPKYTATAVLRLETQALVQDAIRSDSITFVERLENTYARLAASNAVLGGAMRDLGVRARPKLKVEPIQNTELLEVRVTAPGASQAASLANAVSDGLVRRVQELNDQRARLGSAGFQEGISRLTTEIAAVQRRYNRLQVSGRQDAGTDTALLVLETSIQSKQQALVELLNQREQNQIATGERGGALSVVERAEIPRNPTSPNLYRSAAIAIALGLVGGLGMAFLLESLRPTLNTAQDVEEAASDFMREKQSLILGRIPRAGRGRRLSETADGAFHKLRMAVFDANGGSPTRSLLVTSANPGDGKSWIVANLGISLARSGQRILLVDGDLRRPMLHTHFSVSDHVGLTRVLSGAATPRFEIQPTSIDGLSLLAGGPKAEDSSALLERSNLAALFNEMGTWFDVVIIDSPPILHAEDALILARSVDSILLVVSPSGLRRESLREALAQLGRVSGSLLGLVVNRATDVPVYRYGSNANG